MNARIPLRGDVGGIPETTSHSERTSYIVFKSVKYLCGNTEFNNHHSCHSRDTEIRDLRNWSSYGASKWYNICLYVMNHNKSYRMNVT